MLMMLTCSMLVSLRLCCQGLCWDYYLLLLLLIIGVISPGSALFDFLLLYFFSHVDDVDLFNAGVSEFALSGAVLGPTFACIIARQFKNIKFGDRFWYENNIHNPHPFTAGMGHVNLSDK